MAIFPKSIPTGKAGVEKSQAAAKGGTKFTPNLFWKAGEHRYIQFLTEFADIPTVPWYFVNVGKGKFIPENFIDPQVFLEDPSLYNGLADRGWNSKQRQVAVAVEVTPTLGKNKAGKTVPVSWDPEVRSFTRKTGEEVEVPNVGVIVQSHIFYGYLDTYNDDTGTIRDTVFKVTRRGGDQNTAYDFVPQKGEPVDLTEELLNEIDLYEYCKGLADPNRMEEIVEALPYDHVYDQYQKRNDKSSGVKVVKEEFDDEDEPDVEEDSEEAQFNSLKASLQ